VNSVHNHFEENQRLTTIQFAPILLSDADNTIFASFGCGSVTMARMNRLFGVTMVERGVSTASRKARLASG
jgi:hypothetical protein